MTMVEKTMKVLTAETDEDLRTAVRTLTDSQKDTMLFACIKLLQASQVDTSKLYENQV